MSHTTGVLVVSGHPLLCWALGRLAEDSGDLTSLGEADTVESALSKVFALRPAVVVIDCSMLEGAGWRLARELRTRYNDLGIVVLSPEASDDLLFRALDTGASAFLANTAPLTEVLAAIRHAAVAGSSFSASGLVGALQRRRQQDERSPLSARERQVLELLREGRSVQEVAATIYVSRSTAKTYVARLYDKLGAANRSQALMKAVQLGLFDVPEVVAAAAS
jgi:Response regulator containing a CheY-like receiver domain and an HTH DNA-binding domain